MNNRSLSKKILIYLVLIVMLIFALFPIYWMFITSFKTQAEVYSAIPIFWPKEFNFSSYKTLIYNTKFLVNIKNSLIVSLLVSIISILVSSLAAYAISRLKFRGRSTMSKSILYAYLMPKSVLFIPLYILVTTLALNNSLYALVLIYPTITIPYATWMLISYFKSIPKEIEEAAIVDGCSKFGSMIRIVFPLASPGIIATFIFSFTLCWCEYLYALVIISDTLNKTITLGLSDMVVGDIFAWGPLMGGSIIASIPVVIIYTLSSNFLVSGLTLGGVKQ